MGAMITNLYKQNQTANSVIDLFKDGDQGETPIRFVGRPSRVVFAIEASAAGEAEYELLAGGRRIVSRAAVDGGGTDGVFPKLNEKGFNFLVAAGEILQCLVRETAGTSTVDIMATVMIEAIR